MMAGKYARKPLLLSSSVCNSFKLPVSGSRWLASVWTFQPLLPLRSSCDPWTAPGQTSSSSPASGPPSSSGFGIVADTDSVNDIACSAA